MSYGRIEILVYGIPWYQSYSSALDLVIERATPLLNF